MKIQKTTKLSLFQIEKEVIKIDKDGHKSIVTISYKIFFLIVQLMATSLSNLADNLTERIHKIKFKDCDCFWNLKVSKKILQNINLLLAIKLSKQKWWRIKKEIQEQI